MTEETFIVIMLKNKKTGFFEKELGAYKVLDYEDYLVNIFAVEEDEKVFVHMKVSCEREVLDWEFDAIFDSYDCGIYKEMGFEAYEETDCYNPTWTIIFPYLENDNDMEEQLCKILKKHKEELAEVYVNIKELEGEYED